MRAYTRRGFTLVELLVVIGIIVLIIGFALPMSLKAYRSANRSRAAADLNTIAVALDAFRNDFGDYPRVDVPGTGFAVLGKSLIGPFGDGVLPSGGPDLDDPPAWDGSKEYKPGDCVNAGTSRYVAVAPAPVATGPGTLPPWTVFDCRDGSDGPGFRQRTGAAIKPAYLQPGKFKMQGLAIIDHDGNPILYFPQSAVKVNITLGTATTAQDAYYVSSFGTAPAPVTPAAAAPPMYNFDDNGYLATALTPTPANYSAALSRMQAMMGVRRHLAGTTGAEGWLQPGESPATTEKFILWSAGADNLFGPVDDVTTLDSAAVDRAVRKCDDVTSFTH